MANEAQVTVSLSFAKGLILANTLAISGQQVTVTGSAYTRNVQLVTTSKVPLVLGGVVTPGYCLLHNLDATNYVDIFPDGTGAAAVRLLAGESALFRFSGTTPNVLANTASVNLEYYLVSA